MPPSYTYDLFLSYAPADALWVQQTLIPWLDSQKVQWTDPAQFQLGRSSRDDLDRAIMGSRRTLLVLTPAYLATTWNTVGGVLASGYGVDDATWRAIPVLRQPCDHLPPSLAQVTMLDLTTNDPDAWDRLAATLQDEPVAPRTVVLSQKQRNRLRILNKVRQFWLAGVLDQSLHGISLLDLGLEHRPEAIVHPWDLVIERPEAKQTLATGTRLIDLFDAADGTLLLLGAPGAGKTTLLLVLARDLITRAESDAGYPLPLVFNLASWATSQAPLADWLVAELRERYDVAEKVAREWIADDMVLPLLDGLDEVRADVRAACVEAINTFRQAHPAVPFAVCSRIADYEALSTKLHLHDAVLIQPLTAQQVDHYLAQAGSQLAGVRTALGQDPALRELTTSPLLLSIMTIAYAGQTEINLDPASGLDRRTHLFSAYLARMFERRRNSSPWTEDQTRHWLTWLAQRLMREHITVFLIEHIGPRWISPANRRRRYRIVGGLCFGIGFGLLSGLVVDLVNGLGTRLTDGVGSGLSGGLGMGLSLGIGLALIGGFVQGEISLTQRVRWSWVNRLQGSLVSGLGIGIVSGLSVGIVRGPQSGLVFALVGSVIGALGSRLLRGLVLGQAIPLTGRAHWSWKRGLRAAIIGGLISAAALASIGGLISASRSTGLIPNLGGPLNHALLFGLVGLLGGGLIRGLVRGLVDQDVGITTRPNEGFMRARKNTLRFGLIGMLVCTLGFGLVGGLIGVLSGDLSLGLGLALVYGLVGGLVCGFGIALIGGGDGVIQHLLIRSFLLRINATPRDYVAFLDSCVDRLFLQRIGGGYIFVHRLLMEHFAALEPQPSNTETD